MPFYVLKDRDRSIFLFFSWIWAVECGLVMGLTSNHVFRCSNYGWKCFLLYPKPKSCNSVEISQNCVDRNHGVGFFQFFPCFISDWQSAEKSRVTESAVRQWAQIVFLDLVCTALKISCLHFCMLTLLELLWVLHTGWMDGICANRPVLVVSLLKHVRCKIVLPWYFQTS